jgi:FAD/FMN-containing dehydrogenase
MDRHGATHYQIGRYYRLPQENLPLLRALKRAVDPDNRINPGVLGL